jgi:flagellar motor switch protein FliM
MERGTIVLLDAHVGDPVRGVVGPVDAFEGTVAATGGKFAVQVSRNLMDRVEPSKR